jgi:hypothetical protein
MIEEEKKAIEWLKKAEFFSERLYAPVILNLIEKQQKEIEEKTTIIMAGAEKVKQLEKEIEELKLDLEEMTKTYNHMKENWVHKLALNSYIRKDKIRELIEKYEQDYKRQDKEELFNLTKITAGKLSALNELLEENIKEENS